MSLGIILIGLVLEFSVLCDMAGLKFCHPLLMTSNKISKLLLLRLFDSSELVQLGGTLSDDFIQLVDTLFLHLDFRGNLLSLDIKFSLSLFILDLGVIGLLELTLDFLGKICQSLYLNNSLLLESLDLSLLVSSHLVELGLPLSNRMVKCNLLLVVLLNDSVVLDLQLYIFILLFRDLTLQILKDGFIVLDQGGDSGNLGVHFSKFNFFGLDLVFKFLSIFELLHLLFLYLS